VYNPEDTSAETKYMSLVSYKPGIEKIECPFIAVLSVFVIFTDLNLSLYMIFYSNLSCYAEYKLCQIVSFISESLMNIKVYLLY